MVTGFADRGEHVAVTTADGRTFTGAAVVAADGVRRCFAPSSSATATASGRLCRAPHYRAHG